MNILDYIFLSVFNKFLYVLFNVLLFIINLEFGYTYKWPLIFKTFSY